MQNLNKSWIFSLIWWLFWIAFHYLYLVQSGWKNEIALADSLISNILLAALCTGALFSVQYNLPEIKKLAVLFTGFLISAGLWMWAVNQILTELYPEERTYHDFLQTSAIIRFLWAFFSITLFALLGWIIYFFKEKLEESSRNSEVMRLSRESELMHLRQQLQPHFLFNTLNSVSALIGSDPVAAKTMVIQLSDFLRGTLKKEDQKPVPLIEELKYLELYLEIEKVRFGHRLETSVDIEKPAGEMLIPVFLLQPLVENAIKFGLYDTIENVKIEIKAFSRDSCLQLSISNPFDPATSGAVAGTGFGLNAVSRRLFLLFNRSDLLEVNRTNNTFTVMLKIPQSYV